MEDISSDTDYDDSDESFMENNLEYVYLIRLREFIILNKPIYKIGKTKQLPHARFQSYPKYSQIYMLEQVYNCDTIEKEIIRQFDSSFVQKSVYGREYYKGDVDLMKKIIRNVCSLEDKNVRKSTVSTFIIFC
jgi:hypothetical protein